MDPNIFPDTPSGITPTPPNPTPTLPEDDDGSSAPAINQSQSQRPQSGPSNQTGQTQPNVPATAPANALPPSRTSGVHGVLSGIVMGALAGAAHVAAKAGSGLRKAVPYIPVVAAAARKQQELKMAQQTQQQDIQDKQQKAAQEATKSMDEHQQAQIAYNNATLTNHHLAIEAADETKAYLQPQIDLTNQFQDLLKDQGITLDTSHGAGHGGLVTQDAQDAAEGKTIHLFNGKTGEEAGVAIMNTDALNQPLAHDVKMPLRMEINPTTGKLETTDYQTIKADGHNTVGTAFANFQHVQTMGVQAQAEFTKQQANIKAAADAKKAGEDKPEQAVKTVVESSIALVNARKAAEASPTPENLKKLDLVQAEHKQIMDDARAEAAAKKEGGEVPASPAEVQAYEEGRLVLTPYVMARQPQVVDQILATYPKFDMTLAPAYAKARIEFTSGPTGKGINSFNTALNHIGEMWPHINALSATKWAQDLASIAGDKDADAVNTTKSVLADELGKAYKAGALTEGQHDDMVRLLGGRTANELRNNLVTFVTLLNGKLDAFQQQWRTAKPDPSLPDFPVMSPQAESVSKMVLGSTGSVPAGKIPAYSKSTGKMIGYADDANGTNFIKF